MRSGFVPDRGDRLRNSARVLAGAAAYLFALCAVPVESGSEAETEGEAGTEAAFGNASDDAVPSAPEEGGPRRWRVVDEDGATLYDSPSPEAPTIEVIDHGSILSSHGCVQVEKGVWCEVRPLRGGRRGYAAAESLVPARGPDGTVPHGTDDSARRARKKDFDARAHVRCAQERGQEPLDCDAAVARGGGGDAAVVVTFPNGFSRTLFFVHGEFVSASATMSGSGTDVHQVPTGERHLLRVDDQRYELTGEFVFGDH